MQQAIGILETKGMVSLITGTDAMLKSADVEIAAPMTNIGSAIVSVTVQGNVAAVKAAIDAGVDAANMVGEVFSAHVIARPSDGVAQVLPKATAATATKRASSAK